MIELEYRQAVEEGDDPGPWIAGGTLDQGTPLTISPLIEGVSYEARCREVLADGTFSPWAYAQRTRAATAARSDANGVQIAPPTPQNPRIDRDGCFAFDYPAESSPPGVMFEIRSAPGDYAAHDAMQLAHDGVVGPQSYSLCGVPRGERTISVVAVMPNGARSDPAQLLVDRGAFDEGKDVEIESHAEGPAFAGTKTNATVSGTTLLQDAASGAYGPPAAPAYGVSTDHPYDGTVATAQYQFTASPAASGDDGRVLTLNPDIDVRNWQIEWRPTYDDTAGAYGASGDPAYGAPADPVYPEGMWLRWPGSLPVRSTLGDVDIRITMPGGSDPAAALNDLAWRVTRPSVPGAGSHVVIGPSVTVAAIPAGVTEVPGTYRVKASLGAAIDCRVSARVTAGSTPTSAVLYLEYSTDESSWSTLTTNQASIKDPGTIATTWESVPAGAKADVYVRAVTKDGNVSDSATFSNVELQIR